MLSTLLASLFFVTSAKCRLPFVHRSLIPDLRHETQLTPHTLPMCSASNKRAEGLRTQPCGADSLLGPAREIGAKRQPAASVPTGSCWVAQRESVLRPRALSRGTNPVLLPREWNERNMMRPLVSSPSAFHGREVHGLLALEPILQGQRASTSTR